MATGGFLSRLGRMLNRRVAPRGPSGTAPTGDFTGVPRVAYVPVPDGHPDPGEIVWTFVPYEEYDGRGKDRPVLLIAREGAGLLGLMLTSRDHDRDAVAQARQGRHWIDIGSGPWDPRGRASEVRLDRVLRVDPAAVRRIGAVLDRRRYDEVIAELRRIKHW